MAVLVTFLSCLAEGCVSWNTAEYPRFSKLTSLGNAESRAEILRERYDRERLRAAVGDPTIDDGEEWVYVGRFHHVRGMPFTMLLSVYDDRWEVWGMGDGGGHVRHQGVGFGNPL